jgi:hypothetical protein
MSDVQTNESITTEPVQSNEQIDFQILQEKLNQHGEILARLAENPSTVNTDGLKHLSEQANVLAKAVIAIKTIVEQENSTFKTQLTSLMDESLKNKFELEKQKVVKQYNLSDEAAMLLDKIKMEDLDTFGKTLSETIQVNQNNTGKIPKKLAMSNQTKENTPNHLKHLFS